MSGSNLPAKRSEPSVESMALLANGNTNASPREDPASLYAADAPATEEHHQQDVDPVKDPIEASESDPHQHHHDGHYRSIEDEEANNVVTYRRAILTTLPLFMGYAGMIMLQHHIKSRIGIKDSNAHESKIFSAAVAMLYIGNLLLRLMHNVVFTCLVPRLRVVIAFLMMVTAHCILFFAYYVADSKNVAWTFIAYLLAGISIGSFESNVMSCLTPLGHGTKSWAVIGIPVGFNLVSVGFFIAFWISPDNEFIEGGSYVLIALCNVLGMLFFWFVIPKVEFEASADNALKFLKDMKTASKWIPVIWRHCLALMLDMFCVSLFSSIVLYIYDTDDIPLWPRSETTVPRNAFQAVYNLCTFLGDFTSRRIAYGGKARNPLFFVILSAIGAAMVLSKTALVAPPGMFLVMFANGSIYAHSTKFIDNAVDDRYNLVALSMWLFIGDIGSVVGSQLVAVIREPIGPVDLAPTAAPVTLAPNTTAAAAMMASAFSNLFAGVAPSL